MNTEQVNKPVIWNPNSAASWALLFTPIFGAYIQAKNWQRMGQIEQSNKSMYWFYIGCTWAALNPFILHAMRMPIAIAFILSWYFSSAVVQVRYVKKVAHEKAPWGSVLGIAFGIGVLYCIVSFVVGEYIW